MIALPKLVAPAAAVALALSAAGCGASFSVTSFPATSRSATSPAGSAPSSPSSPSSPAAPAAHPAARTAAELRRALLAVQDLPAGFRVVHSPADDDSTTTSTDARCRRLLRLYDGNALPDTTSEAEREFALPGAVYLDEGLGEYHGAAAARRVIASFRAASTACPSLDVRSRTDGAFRLRVREIPAFVWGDGAYAVQWTVVSGRYRGLRLTQTLVRNSDLLLALVFVNYGGTVSTDDIRSLTRLAVHKAEATLQGSTV